MFCRHRLRSAVAGPRGHHAAESAGVQSARAGPKAAAGVIRQHFTALCLQQHGPQFEQEGAIFSKSNSLKRELSYSKRLSFGSVKWSFIPPG